MSSLAHTVLLLWAIRDMNWSCHGLLIHDRRGRLGDMTQLAIQKITTDRVEVGNGVSIPKSWEAVVTEMPDVPGTIRVHVVYDKELKYAASSSVQIDRLGEGDDVTTNLLRKVPVQTIVQWSGLRVVKLAHDGGDPQFLSDYVASVHAQSERDYEATVREAVVLYRVATTVTMPPLKLVSDELRVSISTATRMMARAREAGLADDLITRETYNRIRQNDALLKAPHQVPGTSSGPSIGF